MEEFETRARERVTGYTASLFVVLASFAFLEVVPFLPDPPFLPFLVALGLGALSTRNAGSSVAALYLLVFFAVLWQMIGFGFFQLLRAGVGAAVLAFMVLPLLAFAYRRVELTSMSVAILCVALMFTPAYFVSIPLIAAAATVSGFASVEALSTTFVMLLAPFLMLENALYFVTSAGATSPIIFGQLINLAQNLRPPLPGLNIFLTSLPSNLISLRAQEVSSFLANNWDLLIIPLLLMGAVILVSSVVGGLTRSTLERLANLYEWQSKMRIASPVAVSLVVPIVFVLLIVPLSFPGSGGFQTTLTSDASHVQAALMVGTSLLLGVAFVARESLTKKLESGEIGRRKVLALINKCRLGIEDVRTELDEVSARVPSMAVGPEKIALSEHSSYLADVGRQVGTASVESLTQWSSHIETHIAPSLDQAKNRLRNGVFNELRTLGAVVLSVNSHLEEAGVSRRYTPVPDVPPESSIEMMIGLYANVAKAIEVDTQALFASYKNTLLAFDALMEHHDASVPLGPTPLLDSREYVTAMRLVSEEYWLGFHIRYSEELEARKKALLEQLSRLGDSLPSDQTSTLAGISRRVSAAKPADSTDLLKTVEELRSFLVSVITWLGTGPRLVERMLHSLGPRAAKVLPFQTTRQLDEVLSLRTRLEAEGVGLESLTGFIKEAVPTIASQAAAWKSDQDNLAVAANYPPARKVIERMLAGKKELKVASLPYERGTSEVYARLYASENQGVEYNEQREVLTSA